MWQAQEADLHSAENGWGGGRLGWLATEVHYWCPIWLRRLLCWMLGGWWSRAATSSWCSGAADMRRSFPRKTLHCSRL